MAPQSLQVAILSSTMTDVETEADIFSGRVIHQILLIGYSIFQQTGIQLGTVIRHLPDNRALQS